MDSVKLFRSTRQVAPVNLLRERANLYVKAMLPQLV
jgi:hypothetical protein